ncbi:YaeQ protein [Klebsiella pneumoniae]|nr:YaeQ protein [Klebsiella pneumoniae]
MALKATIYKAAVNVADLDRNQFLDANLTLAQHPSETQERMMLRLLAWIKYADERLQFTRGLSSDDEPELWLLNDHLGVDLWIELGLPMSGGLRKPAHGRRRWRCLPIIAGQLKSGGSRIRASLRRTRS